MAISNLRLNVTANTARALADFNKFSRSLDNKFLISGLKLDVVRNALSQINRDFQRAIGEQGLASASSLRAAQNQAALLTQTFKGFASESALSITQNIGTALNNVAVRAGGTMKDVQKTLAATPFIDINLSEDLRNKLAKGILSFQRDMRRAGLGENFGGLAQQFLMGQATGMQMLNSGDAMQSFLGSQIIKRVGGEGMLYSPEERTKVLSDILNDPEIQKQLSEMAKRAAGFRIILEDLNTKLFNTESGVFGSLRKVIDRTGKSTTMFDEVYKLVDQVFGPNGMFRAIFSSIQEIFGIGDPMRPFIDAIQFVTRIFNDLTAYFESSGFKDILVMVRETFGRVGELFKGVYDQIRGGTFDAEDITQVIGEIGSSVREYIVNISKAIRGEDLTQESGFVSDIAGSLFEEVGKTTVVLIKELFAILLDKVPEIASQVLPAINRGINSILTEAFGEVGAKIVKFILGFVPVVGPIARASAVGDVTGGGGNILSMLAMGAGALAGPAALFGAARLGRGLLGGDQARMGLLSSLTRRTNAVEELYNSRMRQLYLPSAQRVPLSGLLGRVLSPRTAFASPVSFLPSGGGGFGGYRFPTDPMMGPSSPLGQITSRTSLLSGNVPYEAPSSRIFRSRFGKITPETTLLGSNIGYRGATSITPQTTMFRPPTGAELFPFIATGGGEERQRRIIESPVEINRRRAVIEEYKKQYSVQNRVMEELRNVVDTSESDAVPGYIDRSRGNVASRFNRRFGSGGTRAVLRRSLRGFGRGALITSAIAGAGALGLGIFGGPGANAQTMDGVNAAGSVLGGGFEGAMMGATIGSIVPGVGTAAGAVIGGIIGGVAPLLDKGVRDGIGKFISGIGTTMSEFGSGIVRGLNEIANNALQAISSLPSLLGNIVKSVYNSLPAPVKSTMNFFNSVWSGVTGFVSRINLPNMFYDGKDYIGGTMALEARLSGNRPMVVNDGEFVIPRDGFPILAGLVGENLRTTGVVNNGGNQPVQVNISLSVTANSVVADPNELANALREPVYKIVGDAWSEAVNATRVHRARVN